jgi:hypothetical protein
MTGMKILIRWNDRRCLAVNPFGSLRVHIDTPMAVRNAKIIMPVGAVKSDALNSEIADPWDSGKVKACAKFAGGAYMCRKGCLLIVQKAPIGVAKPPSFKRIPEEFRNKFITLSPS